MSATTSTIKSDSIPESHPTDNDVVDAEIVDDEFETPASIKDRVAGFIKKHKTKFAIAGAAVAGFVVHGIVSSHNDPELEGCDTLEIEAGPTDTDTDIVTSE